MIKAYKFTEIQVNSQKLVLEIEIYVPNMSFFITSLFGKRLINTAQDALVHQSQSILLFLSKYTRCTVFEDQCKRRKDQLVCGSTDQSTLCRNCQSVMQHLNRRKEHYADIITTKTSLLDVEQNKQKMQPREKKQNPTGETSS